MLSVPPRASTSDLPIDPLAEIGAGARLGRFHVLAPASGVGGVLRAVVYDPNLDRRVCLHVVAPDALPQVRAEIEAIVRFVARSSTASIVPLLDAGTHRGARFLTTELTPGEETLRARRAAGASWQSTATALLALSPLLRELEEAGLGWLPITESTISLTEDRVRLDAVSLVGSTPRGPGLRASYLELFARSMANARDAIPGALLEYLERARGAPHPPPIAELERRVRSLAALDEDRDAQAARRLQLVGALLLLDAMVPLAIDARGAAASACAPSGALLWAAAEILCGTLAFRSLARDAPPGPLARQLFGLLMLTVATKPLAALGLAWLGSAELLPAFYVAARASLAAVLAVLALPRFAPSATVCAGGSVWAALHPERGMIVWSLTQLVFAASFLASSRKWNRP